MEEEPDTEDSPLARHLQTDKTMTDHHAQRVQEMIQAGKEKTDDPFANMDSLVLEMRERTRTVGEENLVIRKVIEREETASQEEECPRGEHSEHSETGSILGSHQV